MQPQPTASAALPIGDPPHSKYRQCANPDGSAYPVGIERTQFLQGGLVDGVPLVWSFSQRECHDISAKQTVRDGSKKAPALSSCEKNALTIHHAITKAIKDKARANVPRSKVKVPTVQILAMLLLFLGLRLLQQRTVRYHIQHNHPRAQKRGSCYSAFQQVLSRAARAMLRIRERRQGKRKMRSIIP